MRVIFSHWFWRVSSHFWSIQMVRFPCMETTWDGTCLPIGCHLPLDPKVWEQCKLVQQSFRKQMFKDVFVHIHIHINSIHHMDKHWHYPSSLPHGWVRDPCNRMDFLGHIPLARPESSTPWPLSGQGSSVSTLKPQWCDEVTNQKRVT